MRHRKKGRKLGRKSPQRTALGRSLAQGLIKQFGVENREYIVTTKAKAKEYRGFVERLITLGRRSLSPALKPAQKVVLRRRALKLLPDKEAVSRVFGEIATRYQDRPGGYTRVLKTGSYRLGDGAQKVLFAFTPATQAPVTLAPKPVKS